VVEFTLLNQTTNNFQLQNSTFRQRTLEELAKPAQTVDGVRRTTRMHKPTLKLRILRGEDILETSDVNSNGKRQAKEPSSRARKQVCGL
jgi:hypothetical protein